MGWRPQQTAGGPGAWLNAPPQCDFTDARPTPRSDALARRAASRREGRCRKSRGHPKRRLWLGTSATLAARPDGNPTFRSASPAGVLVDLENVLRVDERLPMPSAALALRAYARAGNVKWAVKSSGREACASAARATRQRRPRSVVYRDSRQRGRLVGHRQQFMHMILTIVDAHQRLRPHVRAAAQAWRVDDIHEWVCRRERKRCGHGLRSAQRRSGAG